MKKYLLPTLVTFLVYSVCIMPNIKQTQIAHSFDFKNNYAIILGYDKSMSEKAIKAAVIDSYFRNIVNNGKIVRWNKSTFPLKVYIQETPNTPSYYREIVISAFVNWQRSSEGLVRFELTDDEKNADIKCYFKDDNNSKNISTQSFTLSGNNIKNSVITFKNRDNNNKILDSKQLFSSALQEVGHSLGLTTGSQSIYDVMYTTGTKFNTEITTRDLKTLALLYSVRPDIINKPLTKDEFSALFDKNEILVTLQVPVDDSTDLDNVVANDIPTKLALAEQYRKLAQYDKAAIEYQQVAQMKNDKRSKSEVYYEIAVMYVDAEEFEKAKKYAKFAYSTDINDKTITLVPLVDYYMKQSTAATDVLEQILEENPYNKYAYKLLCQIYRDKNQFFLLSKTIKKYGKTAGELE